MLTWIMRNLLGMEWPPPPPGDVDPEAFTRPPNVAWDSALAAGLRAAPDDPAPYRAYGRWLAEQNDPRGPLILAMLDGADAVLEPHEAQLLGPLAGEKGVTVDWRWGFWRRVRIADPWGERIEELLRAALRHDSAWVLRELELASGRMERVPDVLADGPVLPLRRLVVDAEGSLLGAWATVWSRVPELEELVMLGHGLQVGDLSLPELRTLEIRGPLPDASIDDLKRAHLPALERLRVPRPELLREAFGDRVDAS
jgi:hypothetical protein